MTLFILALLIFPGSQPALRDFTEMRHDRLRRTSDRAGIIDVWGVHIAPDDKSYYYSFMRSLSDLYVMDGLR